ncbi:MAG: ABC transporter ATP-binding protein [Acidimicrobiia bacterium]
MLLLLLSAVTTSDLVAVRLLGAMVDEITTGSPDALSSLFVVFAGIVVASALLGFAQAYVNESVGQTVVQRLRADLHDHLQRLPVSFFTRNRTGEVLSRILTDVNAVQAAVTGTFTELLASLLAIAVAFVLMASLDWQMALVTFCVLPLWVYPTVRVGRRMRTLKGEWHEESANMHAQLDETLSVSGSMVVRAFGRHEHEARRFGVSNDRMRELALRHLIAGRWFSMGTSLFGAMIPGVIYWYGGQVVLDRGSLSTGDVVAFAMLAQKVFGPFATLAKLNTTLLSSAALFERIFDYLDLPVEIDDRPDARTLDAPRGELEFDDVHFGYETDGEQALHGISFQAIPGSMVALVGPSGAGKTTITYLAQRFYDPQHGAVRLDGHDLRDLTLASVAATVGSVMQETYLFHTTLGANIRYGRLDATEDEIRAAASSAGLSRLLDALPDGLDTVVGERGFRLAGGEKQRVAIARAILKDPAVLLLDEATSSLDTLLEREIQGATDELARDRTTVVIAHRLSTVIRADLILVLDGGRIVERGKHNELLAEGGLYASLYLEQFAHDADTDPPVGATRGR